MHEPIFECGSLTMRRRAAGERVSGSGCMRVIKAKVDLASSLNGACVRFGEVGGFL